MLSADRVGRTGAEGGVRVARDPGVLPFVISFSLSVCLEKGVEGGVGSCDCDVVASRAGVFLSAGTGLSVVCLAGEETTTAKACFGLRGLSKSLSTPLAVVLFGGVVGVVVDLAFDNNFKFKWTGG